MARCRARPSPSRRCSENTAPHGACGKPRSMPQSPRPWQTMRCVIAGGGPTGLMLAAELALARVDVAIVERRDTQELAGTRAGGLHARTLEVLEQRGVAERFVSAGQAHPTMAYATALLDMTDQPTRFPLRARAAAEPHRAAPRGLGRRARRADPSRSRRHRASRRTSAASTVTLSGSRTMRADYLVGCDGGRSVVRKQAGIELRRLGRRRPAT